MHIMKSFYKATTLSSTLLFGGLCTAASLSEEAGLPVVPKHDPANLNSMAQVRARDVDADVWHARRQAAAEALLPPDFPPRCAT